MSKKWKRMAALVVAVTTMFAGTLTVSAEGVKDVFDAKYYADTYSDLKAAFGYDEKALYNHYVTYGLSEGRCGSPTFNVVEYRKAYADLEAAFGDNWDAYVNHYFEFGKAEGRTAGTVGSAVAASTAENQQTAVTQSGGTLADVEALAEQLCATGRYGSYRRGARNAIGYSLAYADAYEMIFGVPYR